MNNYEKSKLISISFLVLFVNSLWGFLITKTTFAKPSYVIMLCLVLFALFGLCLVNKSKFKTASRTEVILWLPYLVYTVCGFLLQGSIQFVAYWFVPIVVLLLSSQYRFSDYIPLRIIIISAMISSSGVICQLLLPSIHEAVSAIYVNDSIEKWLERDTGCAGFTYQLATTSALIFAGLMIMFNLYPENKSNKLKYILFALFYATLFLAGKRIYFVMAIAIPMIVNYFSVQMNGKVKKIFLYTFVLGVLYVILMNNLDFISQIPGMKRLADSISGIESNEDITTNRTYLWAVALQMYESSPIFGIGVGRFAAFSEAEMAVHNTYLSVLCEQGVVGFIFYMLPLIVCLRSTILELKKIMGSEKKMWLRFSLFIQLYYILYSLTGNTNSGQYCYQFYFVSIAILVYYKYYHYEDTNISSKSY